MSTSTLPVAAPVAPYDMMAGLLAAMTSAEAAEVTKPRIRKPSRKAGKVARKVTEPRVLVFEPVLLSEDLPELLLNVARLDRAPRPRGVRSHSLTREISPLTLPEIKVQSEVRCHEAHEVRHVCLTVLDEDGTCPAIKQHDACWKHLRPTLRQMESVVRVPVVHSPIRFNVEKPETFAPTARLMTGLTTTSKLDDEYDPCKSHRFAGQFWCELCI